MSEQKRGRRGKSFLKFTRAGVKDRISRPRGVQNKEVESDGCVDDGGECYRVPGVHVELGIQTCTTCPTWTQV